MYAHAKNEIMEVNMKYARANLQVGNIRFSAKSLLHNIDSWFFHVNFLAIDADKGMPIVTLVDDATSWHTGYYHDMFIDTYEGFYRYMLVKALWLIIGNVLTRNERVASPRLTRGNTLCP